MACAPLHIGTCAFAILRQVVGRRLIRQEISILIITYNFPCLSHFHTLNNYKKENSPNQIGKEKMQKKIIYPFQRWIKIWVYFPGLSSRSTRVLWILHLLCGYARYIFFSITSRHLYLPCAIASLHLHTPLGLFGFWIIHRATLIQCDIHLSWFPFMPHPSPLIFMCL